MFVTDSMGLSSFSWWAAKDARVLKKKTVRNGPSRSSEVVDFGTIESAYAISYLAITG